MHSYLSIWSQGVGKYLWYQVPSRRGAGIPRGGVASREGGRYTQQVGIATPMVLTSSGGHQNTYGWQAGGPYSTGMLSCFSYYGYCCVLQSDTCRSTLQRVIRLLNTNCCGINAVCHLSVFFQKLVNSCSFRN